MVVTVVLERFIPWNDPRLGIVGGLLSIGSAESPAAVETVLKEG